MENNKTDQSQRMIAEAIRKIALGRSADRINMAPTGTGGIGTARLIHGYVAKINNNDDEYCGTIDVGEYPDESASSEPVIHKGVLLAGTQNNSEGFLIIPTLYSDVTIVTDAATHNCYVLNYSHAELIQLSAHTEAVIGVTETEELNLEDENSPDYDELEQTGNSTFTRYTAEAITSIAKNKKKEQATVEINPEQIHQQVGKTELTQIEGKIQQKVNSTTLTLADNKVSIGDEAASEPLVLGNQLAQLMLEFLTECSKITTTTLLGTMPAINVPNFASLISKIQNFLSKTSYTK